MGSHPAPTHPRWESRNGLIIWPVERAVVEGSSQERGRGCHIPRSRLNNNISHLQLYEPWPRAACASPPPPTSGFSPCTFGSLLQLLLLGHPKSRGCRGVGWGISVPHHLQVSAGTPPPRLSGVPQVFLLGHQQGQGTASLK